MKIALVIGALSFGGAERVMVNLANFLSEGNEVLLCTMFERPSPYTLNHNITLMQGLASDGKIKSFAKLRKAIKDFRADVVLSFLTQINISTILSLLGTRIPVVVSERNDPAFEPAQMHRKMLRALVYPFAKGFVFQTEEARNYFKGKIKKRGVVISNPVFVEENTACIPFSERNGEFVAIGRLTPQKNYELMISAFSDAAKHKDNLILKIYGDGELKDQLKKEIAINKADNNIFLMGTSTDIHNEIRKSLGFILSSDHEGMPNALLESMALGLCCISTDCPCGGPHALITNGISGILVPVNDRKALSEAILQVAENKALAEMLSQNACKVRGEYSLESIGHRWEEYLKEVAKV